ncbi:hypothetical protein [Spongiibacter marinus]|uniref:hypothetical protein n=1 Tax=Spongiibacter marinus TaxID=354246 RepID=UPI000413F34D|nr:hypothetical protein [Spongiibacter marinus]
MNIERRQTQSPIPHNLEELLSELQLLAIRRVEEFGGGLWFVRRPLFQDVVPVVNCSLNHGAETAVVELDGSLNTSHGLFIRPD